MYVIYSVLCIYICVYIYFIYMYYIYTYNMHIVKCNLKVEQEERSKEEYRGPSWREASQLIDTSAWFLNQVNSGPNQHL